MSIESGLSGLPVIGGFFDDTDQKAMAELQKNQEIYGLINTPEFQDYNPEQYQLAGTYDPEQMQATQIQEDPNLRSQQQSQLMQMAGLANTGLSAVDQAGYEQARSLGNQMQRSGNAAAMANAQARGVGGSGLEFAMREQANQDASQRAQQAGLQQAADSARQRALYNQAYGNQLGSVRSQDYNTNKSNTDILNQFNMANTQAKNQAQQYNLGTQQSLMNMNTGQANQAQQYANQMTQQNYDNQLKKAAGQTGANTAAAGGYAAQNAANASTRNANTALAADAAMGAAGFGPWAKKKDE